MKRLVKSVALAIAISIGLPAHAALSQLTGLFVFGDSLSDAGNSGLLTAEATGFPFPPPPYAGGRYSNGPVAVEYLWSLYNPGDPGGLTPSLVGGTNYAMGGATTGTANFNSVNPIVPDTPIDFQAAFAQYGNARQLQEFLASSPAFDPATSLFVVWLFPNDVFYALQTGMLPGVVPGSPGGMNLVENGISNIATTVQTLASAGARHFLVPNMPDLGVTPAFLDTPAETELSNLTALFNQALAMALDSLAAALPVEIVQFDTEAAFADVRANPGRYGLTNTTDACIDHLLSGLCDPNTWLFWDGVHPTTRTHQLLAAQFRAAVPEPATLMLLGIALAVVGYSRRAIARHASSRCADRCS